jgi:LysM repeat protein
MKMQDRSAWKGMLEPEEERRPKMKAPMLVAAVVGVHVLAVGAVLFIQGCGTTRPVQREVAPPPTPPMPPKPEIVQPVPQPMPRPQFQPVVAPEPPPVTPEAAGGQTYTIQAGDSLSKVAVRYGVSWREVAELNNIRDPGKIRAGQKILLPAHALSHPKADKPKASAPKSAEPAPKAKAAAPAGGYVVQPGDSLSRIAARNGTTIKALKEANRLKSDMIRVGQTLEIPGAASAAKPAAPEAAPAAEPAPAVAPVVVPEPAPAIVEPAPAVAPAGALPGATLPAPAALEPLPGAAEAKPAAAQELTYTFKEGDSLAQIAIEHYTVSTEILKANNLTDATQIKPGQVLRIPVTAAPAP